MLFNSFDFLVFFPPVCLGYWLLPFRIRRIYLLAASYFFYMCWNPVYALLLLASTGITYCCGRLLDAAGSGMAEKAGERQRRLIVAVSLILNLSILFFFKYFNFAVNSVNKLFSVLHWTTVDVSIDVLLPVGISFYIFQALGYTIDVYRGEIKCEKNFLNYALFVSFFPQLVAGPIERSGNLLRQIRKEQKFKLQNVHQGILWMLFGYFQKVVIADNAAILVNQVFDNYISYGTSELLLAILLFAVQIYCDFGGYTNIARGAAKVMGFELMENFRAPYFADSIADFWRRWHISLSGWFRDYLYIPLGGNRKGRIRKYCNLITVFLVSGLWHGASWHYVIWGGLNGLYQIIGDLLKPVRNRLCGILRVDQNSIGHRMIKIGITFFLINLSWVFFRANSLKEALLYLRQMVENPNPWVILQGGLYELGLSSAKLHMLFLAILVLLVTDIFRYRQAGLMRLFCSQSIILQYAVCVFFFFWILICGSYGPGFDASQFIYFQF